MATEVFANAGFAVVTLGGTSAPAAGTVETWTVTSTGCPVAGSGNQFRVVDVNPVGPARPEVMLVTVSSNGTGVSWTVTRGAEGSTVTTHAANFIVKPVVTSGVLSSFAPRRAEFDVRDYGAKGDGTTDDTAAINAAINACQTAGRGVVLFPASPNPYLTAGGHVVYDSVSYEGAGRNRTTLKLKASANATIFTTDQFATNTGTTNGGGPRKFAVRHMKLDGNATNNTSGYGMKLWGYDYFIEDVEVFHFANKGIITEWSEGGSPYSNYYWSNNYEFGQIGAIFTDVDVHHCLQGGVVFNGPHDSNLTDVTTWKCGADQVAGVYGASTTVGLEIGSGSQTKSDYSAATILTRCHSWGSNQLYPIVVGATNIILTECQGEGAQTGGANLWGFAGGLQVRGGRYFQAGASATDIGIRHGDISRAGYSPGDWFVDTKFTRARYHFDGDGGNNTIRLHCYNPYGPAATTTTGTVTFPQGTINVVSTAGFPAANGDISVGGQLVHYSAVGAAGTSFTGCGQSGPVAPTGTFAAGTAVTQAYTDATAPQYAVTGALTSSGGASFFDVHVSGGGLVGPLPDNPQNRRIATRQVAPRLLRGSPPAGAVAQTMDRNLATGDSASLLATGRLSLTDCGLVPAGTVVSNITLVAGATAMVTPTHQWFALFDANYQLLAVTHDDTTTAWAVSGAGLLTGAKTLAIENIIAGPSLASSATWTAPVDMQVYVGAVVTAATVPSIVCAQPQTGVAAIVPYVSATSNTGLTDPTTCPRTATALTPNSKAFYAVLT